MCVGQPGTGDRDGDELGDGGRGFQTHDGTDVRLFFRVEQAVFVLLNLVNGSDWNSDSKDSGSVEVEYFRQDGDR